MTKDNTNFIDPSKKTLYGKHGAEFWIGKIVGYADQKEQIEDGFGWRYKVIILGDNSETDQVEDKYYSYASVLLPTTAGTGAAYKLRSVRLSQGDMVFGVRGGGTAAPKFIIGSIPRTRKTATSSGKFGTLSGFYGSLTKNKTLDGEFNEQIGPATPGVTPVGPKNYNKAIAKEPSKQVEQLGINPNDNKPVENVEELLTPPTTDPNKKWTPPGPPENVKLEDGTLVKANDVKVTDTIDVITAGGIAATVPAGTDLNASGTVPVTVVGPLGNPMTVDYDVSKLTRPEPIANSQIKKLLTNTSAEEVVAVVDGITPKVERTVDSNTGLYRGQSAHQYPGGVEEYWKKIESQRELTVKEQRRKEKGRDQFGRTLESNMEEVKLIDSVAYYRVKAENGTYVYESPKPGITYKKEYKAYVNSAIDQGIRQNLIDSDLAKKAQLLVGSGDFDGALNLLYPPPPPTTT